MPIFRVQDDLVEKKRVMIDESGNVKIGPGPINISVGYPDHALYFLSLKNQFDVVQFSLADEAYYEILRGLQSQKAKKKDKGAPTFNDPTKPGFKIEIPKDSPYLEVLANGIDQGTGKVTGGQEFFQQQKDFIYSKGELADFVKSVREIYPRKNVLRQVKKAVEGAGLGYDESTGDIAEDELGLEVDWKGLNDKLWEIFNNEFDKDLRGVK